MIPTSQPQGARHRAPLQLGRVIRAMLTGIASVTTAVVVATLAAGGTFAYLNATASVASATTITAGTANFTVAAVTPLNGTGLTPLPTSAAYGTYTVTNLGDVKLTLTPAVTASSANTVARDNMRLDLALVPTSTACTAASYTWSQVGNAAPSGSLAQLTVRDRIGNTSTSAAMRLCARASLLSTAPNGAQNATVSWTVTLNGAQAW